MGTNQKPQRLSIVKQILFSIGFGLAVFISFMALLNGALSLFFIGRIMPGVVMNGYSLSGMSIEEAASTIAASYRFPQTGSILLTDGDKSWMVRPVQLGFYLDPVASANAAYEVGRRGTIISILTERMNIFKGEVEAQPSFVFDQKTAVSYLSSLANEINQSIREAGISINGTEVVVQNGQQGKVLDVPASLEAVSRQVQSMLDGAVPLVIRQTDPVILSAEEQGQIARSVLSQPITLTIPVDSSGNVASVQIQPIDLAPLLTFEKKDNQYQIAVSTPLITAYLENLKDSLDLNPENPRLMFNDDTGLVEVIKPAVIGRSLEISNSITAINQALQSGSHSAELAFTFSNPQVTDQMTGAELGITELVQAQTTYFAGSTDDRIQNIQKAAEHFHGLLVAPGATVSMADVLGEISPEKGYTEALIILEDQTIKGIGGGVCQVSTTLFRTALYAGFPILERHAHAYRVGYYEQVNSSGSHDQSLAGFDAAVFVPIVDFKFINDTSHWLLMETYVSPTYKSLTWKFYSTKDGREVAISSSGLSNIVDSPEPVYRENPELPTGTKKQVDWAVKGADVTVTRTVTRNGETLTNDKFFTRYEPWGDVFEYGPGTENIPTSTPTP